MFWFLCRALVEDVMAGHENAKQAKKSLQQYKSKIVQEVNEESKELMKQALELVWFHYIYNIVQNILTLVHTWHIAEWSKELWTSCLLSFTSAKGWCLKPA